MGVRTVSGKATLTASPEQTILNDSTHNHYSLPSSVWSLSLLLMMIPRILFCPSYDWMLIGHREQYQSQPQQQCVHVQLSINIPEYNQSLMKTEESLSNESLGEQRRRFNGSSASSTPENEQLPLRGKFIEFQQYGSIAATSNAVSLKIRIDDEEEHERGVIEETSESQASAREDPYEQQYQSDDHLQLLIQYRQKIDRLSSRVITLEERLYYYEDYNRRLLRENEQIRGSQEQHCHRLQQMEQALEAKQHNSQLQKELILNLNKKIEYLEAQQGYLQGFAQRLNQKDGKLRELSKTLERMLQINHELETELRQANRKIVQLEKDTQRLSCMQIEQNLFRIKEQAGKQNLDGNGGYRKSLRRADRPVTFKTEPNERISEPFERVHFSRNF